MRIAIAALLLSFFAAPVLAQAPKGFLTDWKEAKKAAIAAKKPIYIHFTTTGCKWCAKLNKEVYTDKAVAKLLEEYVCVVLDCTQPAGGGDPPAEVKVNTNLMDRLGGTGYPFLVMVTTDGVMLNSVSNFVPAEELVKEFNLSKKMFKEYQEFMLQAKKADKKSYEYNLKALVFFQKVHHSERATDAANKVLELDPDNEKGDRVLAKLVLLEFSEEMPDATMVIMDEIFKLDPQNEKSAYEKALLLQVSREYAAARSDRKEAQSHLEAMIRLVDKARAAKIKLKNPTSIYTLAAIANVSLENYDKAVEAAEWALASCKDTDEAARIKDFIEQVKKKKAQGEPAPTTEPVKEHATK